MSWRTIDTQSELDALDGSVCWEDASVLEYHAGRGPRAHYPRDVSRSGYDHLDIHVLVRTAAGRLLELGLIHCERLGPSVFEQLHLRGTVDSLKRVEIHSGDGSVLFFAGRVLYRWLDSAPDAGSFYWPRDQR